MEDVGLPLFPGGAAKPLGLVKGTPAPVLQPGQPTCQSLADLDSLPDPDILAADIMENLQSAMDSFQELMASLKQER